MSAFDLVLSGFDREAPTLVGFSGGLDSSVLLHRLSTLLGSHHQTLRAVHVHHGLTSQADAWVHHCQSFCDSLAVDMSLLRVEVPFDLGRGPEASAREVRYRAFASLLLDGERLALAHHQDDQAETVLLRLLRGSASEGLAAMRPVRSFARGTLWRPLLAVPRSRLLHYAREHRLQWIDDPSNSDVALDRNFLRHRVLPVLSERWPQARKSLARSAELLSEDALLLVLEAQQRLARVQGLDPQTLSTKALLALEPAWRSRVMIQWLAGLSLPPLPGSAFAVIERELLLSKRDAEPQYHWAGVVLRRWRDLLHVENKRPRLPEGWQTHWNGMNELVLPTGDVLRLRPVSGGVESGTGATRAEANSARPGLSSTPMAPDTSADIFTVRARHGGERITLPGRGHSHALKKALLDCGVPVWDRERLPLLFAADGELLAAGDLLISARWQAWCRDRGKILSWRPVS